MSLTGGPPSSEFPTHQPWARTCVPHRWAALERYFKAVDRTFNAQADSDVNFMNMGVLAAGEAALRILLGGVRRDGELAASYSTPVFDEQTYAAWLQVDHAAPRGHHLPTSPGPTYPPPALAPPTHQPWPHLR